jgi:16S rRNA processing protein RimM
VAINKIDKETSPYLTLGQIAKPHALKGELKIDPYFEMLEEFPLEDPPVVFYLAGREAQHAKQFLNIEKISVHQKQFLVRFNEVSTLEAAQALKGKTLYFEKEQVESPKGFFYEELIDAEFRDEKLKRSGRITDIYQTPAHFILELSEQDKIFDMPFVSPFVLEFDRDQNVLKVNLSPLLES